MLEKYLHSLEVSGKSDRTIATRKGQLSSFFVWLLKETNSNDPLEITSIDAAKYRKLMKSSLFILGLDLCHLTEQRFRFGIQGQNPLSDNSKARNKSLLASFTNNYY
jgi:hypothetical protein